MSPSDYEMIEQGYDPPRISEDLLLLMTQSNTLLYGKEMATELIALRDENRRLREARMNEGELIYTGPGELAALRAQNAELVAALKGVLAEADRKTDAFDRARAALRYAAPPASGEAK